jgi:hypothetical protein
MANTPGDPFKLGTSWGNVKGSRTGPDSDGSILSGNDLQAGKNNSASPNNATNLSTGAANNYAFGAFNQITGGSQSVGIIGQCIGETKGAIGVAGVTDDGCGVYGFARIGDESGDTSIGDLVGQHIGVLGDSSTGFGVHGRSVSGNGVAGRADSPGGTGVLGFSLLGGIGVKGDSNSNDGVVGIAHVARQSGVFGGNDASAGPANGVTGKTESRDGAGVLGFSLPLRSDGMGGLIGGGIGVKGDSGSNNGVEGIGHTAATSGVFGSNVAQSGRAFGVSGFTASPEGAAVQGFTDDGDGVLGTTKGFNKSGVFGEYFGDPKLLPRTNVFGVSQRGCWCWSAWIEPARHWGVRSWWPDRRRLFRIWIERGRHRGVRYGWPVRRSL